MTKVIVLRPEPGASETVDRAKARGLDAFSIPLFVIEPLNWSPPETSGFDALLLTSANAVRFGGDQLTSLRGLPVHAVGNATADAAREAGFDIASSGDAGVERLLGSLEADLRLLHVCGEDRRDVDSRQHITAISVYRSKAIEPAPDIRTVSGAVVMIHSPRAGQQFAELTDQQEIDREQITLLAISAAAAKAAGSGWKRVETAEHPSDNALLVLAERLCDKGDEA